MAGDTREEILSLLQPTHDTAGWLADIGRLHAPLAIPILVEIMNEEPQPMRVRVQAISLLGLLRNAQAVGPLMQMLQTSVDAHLKAQAALSLGQIGTPEETILPALLKSLNDADDFVRESSAKALALLRSPSSIPALERMQSADRVSTNREVAEKALRFIRQRESS